MANIYKTVCFVCYGNMCRSPMATAIMGDIIQNDPSLNQRNIEICSAGTGAIPGRTAHPNAQKTMKEWRLTVDHHVSSPISSDIVDRADLIVALDSYVEEDIINSYPSSLKKICTLDITDPYGDPIEAYRQCAQQIRDNCMSKVLPLVKLLG